MSDFPLKAHPRSEDGEEKDTKRSRRTEAGSSSSTRLNAVADDDLVVRQILSRLPVKSLMRFKCVCKAWKSIIEDDSEFINLHYAHSQARSPGLLVVPNCTSQSERPSFFKAELHFADDDSKISGATIHRLGGGRTVESTGPFIIKFIGPVRGLLCVVDIEFAVRVYNVSTCQAVTPWISPTEDMHQPWYPYRSRLGFDPRTGNYKVVLLSENPAVCLVLTVGIDASWRRIDQVPPCILRGDVGAYVNGSIYWITFTGPLVPPRHEIDVPSEEHREFLVAFDVGSEKFRVIKIPSFTFWGYSPLPYLELLEMDGCVTVVRGRRRGAEYNTMKMWKFHDCGKLQGTNGTSSSSIEAEQDWTEVTIELPPPPSQLYSFQPIPGKDLMIIGFGDPPGPFDYPMRNVKFPSLGSYNMISKTFSKFEVQGTSLLPGTGFSRCAIFAECLFSGTGNVTYPAPSVRPVPNQNKYIAIEPWLSSPPTQGYRCPTPGCPALTMDFGHSCRIGAGSSGLVTQKELERRLKEKDEEVARLRGIVEGFDARLVALGLQATGAAAGSSQQSAPLVSLAQHMEGSETRPSSLELP